MNDTNKSHLRIRRKGRPTIQEAISRNQITSGGAALLLGITDSRVRTALMNGHIKLINYTLEGSGVETKKIKEYRFDIDSIALYAIMLYKKERRPITSELIVASTHCSCEVKHTLRNTATGTTMRHLAEILVSYKCDTLTGILAYLAMPFRKFRERITRSRVLNAMYEADELNDSSRKSYDNPDSLIIEEITKRGFYMDYLTIRADEHDTQRTALVIPSDHQIFGVMCVLVGNVLADLNDDQELGANFIALATRHGYVPYTKPKTESEKKLVWHFAAIDKESRNEKSTAVSDVIEELRSTIA